MSAGGKARLVVLIAVLLTAALYVVPYGFFVAYPLFLLSTFAHEMGHGLVAEIVGGDFISFHMFPDGSGVAQSMGAFTRLEAALVAAGGLVGPAILAGLFFTMCTRPQRARIALWLFALLTGLSLVWVVRGVFGWAFVASIATVCGLIAYKGGGRLSQGAVAFLATQLSLAVFSRSDYLFTESAVTGDGNHPSDVAVMAQALLLPYWFWGAVCGAFSLVVLAGGLWAFWRGTR